MLIITTKLKRFNNKMNYSTTKHITGLILLALAATSCNKTAEHKSNIFDNDEAYDEYANVADTIDGKAVSHDCAIIYTHMKELKWRWEDINSPSALARHGATWKKDISNIEKEIKEADDDERLTLDSVCDALHALHDKQVKAYSVPASGVIANLQNCIKSMDQANTLEQFASFRLPREGMLREVENIHYCVEPSSHEIKKVKHLAHIVKMKYEEKCNTFGIER